MKKYAYLSSPLINIIPPILCFVFGVQKVRKGHMMIRPHNAKHYLKLLNKNQNFENPELWCPWPSDTCSGWPLEPGQIVPIRRRKHQPGGPFGTPRNPPEFQVFNCNYV